jgi:hypothetical protein
VVRKADVTYKEKALLAEERRISILPPDAGLAASGQGLSEFDA